MALVSDGERVLLRFPRCSVWRRCANGDLMPTSIWRVRYFILPSLAGPTIDRSGARVLEFPVDLDRHPLQNMSEVASCLEPAGRIEVHGLIDCFTKGVWHERLVASAIGKLSIDDHILETRNV